LTSLTAFEKGGMMKTKNILILLFILLFTGVALLASTQAIAQTAPCECDDPTDNSCIKIGDYVVRISPHPFTGEWPIVCDPGTQGDDYCKLDGATEQYLDFRWEACLPTNANCKDKKLDAPTWSYFLQMIDLEITPKILGSYPEGARLILPGDPNNCDLTVADEDTVIWKLNPSVTCEKAKVAGGVRFSMYTQLGVLTSICNMSAATFQSTCKGDYLLGPDNDGTLPVEEHRSYCYSSDYQNGQVGRIQVTYDRCSGDPVTVSINNNTDVGPRPTYFCEKGEGTYTDCHQISACGSGVGGCYLCMDPPVYIHGENVYRLP